MTSDSKKAGEPHCAPDDTECLVEEIERELADPHVPLDGSPPEHWKHVDSPVTEEERLQVEAAKEEHQERAAKGRHLGKI
jgi:hypothetical protein